ncbi:MAG: tRNA guanosine(34) transglycosylase Tgt [Ignavibacteriales bacterium]|nr:tRNA guanosine(34) transglycosylase Tgt [Ignavibacteriales bacterium]
MHTEVSARAGWLETDHGVIETPIFMPVGTQGSVKAVEQREMSELGAQIILGNAYHLYLRPGVDVLKGMGGLHRFMNWEKPILTDSGGYQVFSLTELRKITNDGVTFRSHVDGSSHYFTPEKVMEIEHAIGSDIMMVLDECTPYPCEHLYAKKSNEMTVRWAKQCQTVHVASVPLYGHRQALFAIVQGSVFRDIRKESATALVDLDFEGYAIGGLAVGEPAAEMYDIAQFCTDLLPAEKPRYLMGVGTPENILECIERGIDMFDCVMPTRNGRNSMVFTRDGRVNLRNAKHRTDSRPVDGECSCYGCRNFSRAYLRHLFQVKEILALQLASMHNLTYYLWLVKESRRQIIAGTFSTWKREMIGRMNAGSDRTTG